MSLKFNTILIKISAFSIIGYKCGANGDKIFQEDEFVEKLELLF